MQSTHTVGSADDHEEASDLEEGVPLLPKDTKPPPSDPSTSRSIPKLTGEGMREAAANAMQYASAAATQPKVFGTSHHNKLLCYDHDTLLTSSAVMLIGRSVFAQKPVLYALAYCSFLAASTAVCVFFVPKASKLDTQKFEDFGTFLKFFIVFMLGIYVQQAFARWWLAVTHFEKILIAIRQFAFMLHTIRCTPTARRLIENYCIASGYILNVEVRNAQIVDKRNHVSLEGVYKWLVSQGMLSEEEVDQLGKDSARVLGKTQAIWSWIGELASHPDVEEGVSVMPPLLMRTIMMCQNCVAEIESLKMNITMQIPFLYAQLLAILVHVNNILLSVCCGMALGSSMNEIRRRSEQLAGERKTGHNDVTVMEQLYGAIQTLAVQLLIVLLSPMLYIAFLHIAHVLCYPFGNESYHLPTETLIARLHSDLNRMSENRAYFRDKHTEFKEQEKIKCKQGKDDEFDDDDCGE